MAHADDRPEETARESSSQSGYAPPDPSDPPKVEHLVPRVFEDNRLLASLTKDERDKLSPYLERVYLDFKQILYEVNEQIEFVYFPINGVGSMITIMEDGSRAEVGTVGNEGMIGMPVLLGATSMPGQAFSQVPGDAFRMSASDFREATSRNGHFVKVMHLYLQALFTQIAQSTACNSIHPTEQRFARWILMTHDRVGADTFTLTQEFLSQMLGVRRATVSEVARKFQQEGIIQYRRGRLTILDRKRLEEQACECYAVIKAEFDRLLSAEYGEETG